MSTPLLTTKLYIPPPHSKLVRRPHLLERLNAGLDTASGIILIAGANGGLGKECARQLALLDGTEKIYLGCRNEERAKAAKLSLEESTGKSIFEIVLMDVSNPDSVRSAVESLNDPIDALVMNAGGMGGKNPGEKTDNGVIQLFAVNVFGHVILLDELLLTLENVCLVESILIF